MQGLEVIFRLHLRAGMTEINCNYNYTPTPHAVVFGDRINLPFFQRIASSGLRGGGSHLGCRVEALRSRAVQLVCDNPLLEQSLMIGRYHKMMAAHAEDVICIIIYELLLLPVDLTER